jgi:hypothetical protein
MRVVTILSVILIGALASAQETKKMRRKDLSEVAKPECAQGAICFSAEIGEGQKYRKDLSGDLAFVLTLPGDFAVQPKNAGADCEKLFWVADPPFHAHRLTEIDASYDWTAEQEVQTSPREFRFATDCGAYKTLYDLYQADSDKYVAALDSLRKGQGRFWITASRVTHSHGLNGEHNGAVEWIQFSVEIKLPKTD